MKAPKARRKILRESFSSIGRTETAGDSLRAAGVGISNLLREEATPAKFCNQRNREIVQLGETFRAGLRY